MEIVKLFSKFMIVGMTGVLINMAVYTLFLKCGVPYFVAASISFLFAVTNNFVWNFLWTFSGRAKDKKIGRKYMEFFIISFSNFILNLLILRLLVETLKLDVIISQFIAIGAACIFNFIGNFLHTFKEKVKK